MIRIAVCDDNREDCYEERDCLQTVLNEYGMDYKIDLFFDTERLYKALHDRLFDLIVSDTFLDGRDMFDFVRMLREEKYPIRVIFVSGREDCAVRAYQVFALDCFSKPLTPLRLRQIVDYLSCLHRLPRRLSVRQKTERAIGSVKTIYGTLRCFITMSVSIFLTAALYAVRL